MSSPSAADRRRPAPVPLAPLAEPGGSARLPQPLTPLVGRVDELVAVTTLLRGGNVRLVTLTGPGGVGKTRLAIAAASAVAEKSTFADGVAFVALAAIRDPDLVVPTVARALGLREAPERSMGATLATYLRDRRFLLVLDNLEQVPDAASELAELLQACPELRVLATSRAPLRVYGEQVFPVKPLAVPATDQVLPLSEVEQVEAVALFVQRAQAVRPDFELSAEHAPAIAEICRRLDGLPLAIELAAPKIRLLSPGALLARLAPAGGSRATTLPLLEGGPRDQPDRLRTMRNAVAWSHDLLAPAEQALFRRLAVFAGGWTLEAADEVSAVAELGLDIFAGISSLVEQSLVHRVGPDDAARFGMLEPIREYALERLVDAGEEPSTRERHAAWCQELADWCWTVLAREPTPRGWQHRIDPERDNLRAALAWLAQTGSAEASLRLAGALFVYWFQRGSLSEGRRWLEQALAIDPEAPAALRAPALTNAAWLSHHQGNNAYARSLLEQGLALYRAIEDRWGIAEALFMLGAVAEDLGDRELAAPLMEQACALYEAVDDPANHAYACQYLGKVAFGRGDFVRAGEYGEEALRRAQALDDATLTGLALEVLGLVAHAQGDLVRAAASMAESLSRCREGASAPCLVHAVADASIVAMARGEPDVAARLFGAAETACLAFGYRFHRPVRATYERAMVAAQAALGETAFTAALAAGRALSLDEGLAEASALLARPHGTATLESTDEPGTHSGLTLREREVLRLVAEGRSDKEIAAALSISPRTVGRHLENLRAKLGVDSRAAAAALAVRRGLV
jgi:predicted ATPase/DNA-binding CsgD family transcriptional regulator